MHAKAPQEVSGNVKGLGGKEESGTGPSRGRGFEAASEVRTGGVGASDGGRGFSKRSEWRRRAPGKATVRTCEWALGPGEESLGRYGARLRSVGDGRVGRSV